MAPQIRFLNLNTLFLIFFLYSAAVSKANDDLHDHRFLEVSQKGLIEQVVSEALPWMEDTLMVVFDPASPRYLRKTGSKSGGATISLQNVTGSEIAAFNSASWPLLMNFRPNSTEITFVEDNNGDRHFKIKRWNFESGEIAVMDTPILSNAARWFRWTKSGDRLALIATNSQGNDDVWVVEFKGTEVVSRSIVYTAASISCVNWSPDEKTLVGVSELQLGQLIIIDTETQNSKSLKTEQGLLGRDCFWSPSDGKIYFRGCENGTANFILYVYDTKLSALSALSDKRVSVTSINLTDNGVIYNTQSEDESTITLRNKDDNLILASKSEARLQFLAAQSNKLYFTETNEQQPETLRVVDLESKEHTSIIGLEFPIKNGVKAERISSKSEGGDKIEGLLWKPAGTPPKGIVISFPVRRTFGPTPTFDGTTQFLVQKGYAFLAFDYTPTTDRQPGWDLRISDRDVACALQITQDTMRHIDYRGDNIVAFGESNSTLYAMKSAAAAPNLFKKIVLRGLTGNAAGAPVNKNSDIIVYSLQGEKDRMSPELVQTLIKLKFPDVSGTKRLLHVVVRDEGHVIRKPAGRAVRAALLKHILSADYRATEND